MAISTLIDISGAWAFGLFSNVATGDNAVLQKLQLHAFHVSEHLLHDFDKFFSQNLLEFRHVLILKW